MTALKFPGYIPSAARDYINEIMEGANGAPGYVSLRDGKRKALRESEERLNRLKASGDVTEASRERDKCNELRDEHDYLDAQVACMLRFAQHLNMKEAYPHLAGHLEDHQWEHFLYSAWAARKDYRYYRDRLARAKEVRNGIAEAADKLAALLNESMAIGLNYPFEFFSIPALLKHTDNTESVNDYAMWQALRPTVLGLAPPKTSPTTDGSDSQPGFHLILQNPGDEPQAIDASVKMRNMIGNAWEKAPYLSALLETLAQSAHEYEPQETNATAAAIASRKSNRKTEYLRAFATLLTENYRIRLTKPIMEAMALVATVALDDPNIDASYDDVRKAIKNMNRKPLEDSAEK